MKKWVNVFLLVGSLCTAVADAEGSIVPPKLHGYLTLGAIVAAVLAKSPLFNDSEDANASK